MTGSERGFTIIEVVLFLAITGGLFAALMIGVGVGISQQRYLDSVRSYKSLLQDQYIAAINTRNEGNSTVRCSNSNNGSIESNVESRTPSRGSSNCVILGRAIQITENAGNTEIVTSSVTGYDPSRDDGTSDNSSLVAYQPKLALFDRQVSTINWDGSLRRADGQGDEGSNNNFATAVILILRSPASGSIVVYTSDTSLNGSDDLSSLFNGGLQSPAIVKSCVAGESGMLPKQMIVIDPKISGPDAVSSDGGANEVCQR